MTAEPGGHQDHRIVVGVDGSVSSKAALAWAIDQARRTGAVVEAVTAWEYPISYGYPAPLSWNGVDFAVMARKVVSDAIAEVTAGTENPPVRSKVFEGNPARVLLSQSAGADLLVIGSRGHGGFVEALLGSTSQHCVHHATCPVVVIRDSVTSHAQPD